MSTTLVIKRGRTEDWAREPISTPLMQAFPAFGDVKEFRKKVCILSHDRSKVFAVVSDRYQLVKHSDAIAAVEGAILKGFKQEPKRSLRTIGGGSGIVANFTWKTAPSLQPAKGDMVGLQVQLRNSYDGSSPFNVQVSALRLACTNGMTFGNALGRVNFKHYPGNLSDLGALSHSLQGILSGARSLETVWRDWIGQKITYEEATALIGERFPAKYRKMVLVESKFPMSAWSFYNEMTAMATHHTNSFQTQLDFSDKIAKLFYKSDASGEKEDGDYEIASAI